MFTALGNIFSPKHRHQAEQADTRQNIQRHDPEFERRGKKKARPIEEELQQDNALVSVEALKIFLENFVRNNDEDGQTEPAQEKTTHPEENLKDALDYKIQTEMELSDFEAQALRSGKAALAASAYQNMAQANEKSKILLETTDQSKGPTLDLSAADIRVIHVLIEDLKILDSAHIEYLHIQRAATFLDSLVNAVKTVKAGLPSA